jgi:hypothetical protein
LYADYREITWNDRYRVPKYVLGDICEYPLARNLVLIAVAERQPPSSRPSLE